MYRCGHPLSASTAVLGGQRVVASPWRSLSGTNPVEGERYVEDDPASMYRAFFGHRSGTPGVRDSDTQSRVRSVRHRDYHRSILLLSLSAEERDALLPLIRQREILILGFLL